MNLITIRVEDTGAGGGIWGEANMMKLETEAGTIALAGEWKYKLSPVGFEVTNPYSQPNRYPTLLYNGMISPLLRYSMQGIIWYQGESNTERAEEYKTLFPLLINDWRSQFSDSGLAFLFVQLANYNLVQKQPAESEWAELREAQMYALSLPKTAMAVAIDLGEATDIHPRNKRTVGYRLSLAARNMIYNDPVECFGPVYKSMKIINNRVIVYFDHAEGIKCIGNKNDVCCMEVAGPDKKFYRANAIIEGDSVIVSSSSVISPFAVRYAWADNPGAVNLYNKAGLPASPFRTDTWPGMTK